MRRIPLPVLLLLPNLITACERAEGPSAAGHPTNSVATPAATTPRAVDPPAKARPDARDDGMEGETVQTGDGASEPAMPRDDRKVRTADGATMVRVPAGPFIMGSPKDFGDEDEEPQRRITLAAFWIDRLETTRAQYAKCVEAGACKAPAAPSGAATAACNWPHADRAEHPINCVTHQEAVDYCGWAGARLPTEAEWEKAARGDDGRRHPWGNSGPTCDYAVMPTPQNIAGCGSKTTMPVGSKPKGASPYGALDMSGNVWEWVADRYREDYYATAPAENPKGPERGVARSLRGGAWEVHDLLHLRTANRYRFAPTMRFHALGIRCAQDG